MEKRFDGFEEALRVTVDFCRDADVGVASAMLLAPIATLHPIIYYVSRQPRCSVPEAERGRLKTLLYFLLFNEFVSSDARIRWLREVVARTGVSDPLPIDELLDVVKRRQRETATETSATMLNWNPRLALNIVQRGVARETLSWQSSPEVDHIFPQAVYRPKYGDLVDDIGNLGYLGKLRNIRKSKGEPASYFEGMTDTALREEYLIEDRALLAPERFEEFVAARRESIVSRAREFLGR